MVLGSFALLKATAHLQCCLSLCLPDEGSFSQCHHHTMVCLTALQEHATASIRMSGMASFNSSCVAEGSGHSALQGRQEEEQGVTSTGHKSGVVWAVCCLLLPRLTAA